MTNATKITVVLALLLTTIAPIATPAPANMAAATWISATPVGLAYVGQTAEVQLDVALDGRVIASSAQTFDWAHEPSALSELVAEAQYEGDLTDHELGLSLRDGNRLLLEIRGEPTVSNGVLALRVTRVDYPTASPVVATGPAIFQVEHGWNDETLTVGFAWSEPPQGDVAVELEAHGDGTNIRTSAPAVAMNGTAWKTQFHLDRLPAVLVWKATILLDNESKGTTGSTVSFPTRAATNGYFSPVPGGDLVTAGGFHEVGGHKEVIRIDRSVLAPIFEAAADCPNTGAYDTVNGETWRLTMLAKRASGCAPPAEDTGAADTSPSEADVQPAGASSGEASAESALHLGGLLMKVLATVLVVLLVVYIGVARRRRTP